jgi:hypothetical protein
VGGGTTKRWTRTPQFTSSTLSPCSSYRPAHPPLQPLAPSDEPGSARLSQIRHGRRVFVFIKFLAGWAARSGASSPVALTSTHTTSITSSSTLQAKPRCCYYCHCCHCCLCCFSAYPHANTCAVCHCLFRQSPTTRPASWTEG